MMPLDTNMPCAPPPPGGELAAFFFRFFYLSPEMLLSCFLFSVFFIF